jgi:hypothetical protein
MISVFGCPYNLHPEKPWLRRTIRGSIAAGVIITSPILMVGAVAVAAVALPGVGVYRLAQHIRIRRHARQLANVTSTNARMRTASLHSTTSEYSDTGSDEARSVNGFERSNRLSMIEHDTQENDGLSYFANMDVENLFTESIASDNSSVSSVHATILLPSIKLRRVLIRKSCIDVDE